MADTGKPGEFTTVIGSDATFKGELAFESGVRIDGRLEGKITTKGRLQISKEGKLQADVEAGSISVEGTITGNMTAADRIEVRESAQITGDIVATRLSVAEGARISGQLLIGASGKPPQTGMGGSPGAKAPTAPPPSPKGKGEGS